MMKQKCCDTVYMKANKEQDSQMNFKTIVFFILTILSVTACGGGGGGSNDTPTTNPPVTGGSGGGDGGSDDGDSDDGDSDTGEDDGDSGDGDGDTGGGDDGGEQPEPDPEPEPTPDMTATRSASVSEIDEGEQANIVYQLENPNGAVSVELEPTLIGGASAASYSSSFDESNNTVTVTLQTDDDVIKLGRIQLVVTITDEAGTVVTFNEDVYAKNASGEEKIADVQAYVDGLAGFLEFNEEDVLVDRLNTLSLMMNPGVGAQSDAVESVATLTDDYQLEQLESSVEVAQRLIESYRNMEGDEIQLDDFILSNTDILKEFASPVAELVNAVASNVGNALPELAVGDIYIEQETGTVSMFVGNPAFGSFEDGEWRYSDSYAFMNEISFPYTATCNAE